MAQTKGRIRGKPSAQDAACGFAKVWMSRINPESGWSAEGQNDPPDGGVPDQGDESRQARSSGHLWIVLSYFRVFGTGPLTFTVFAQRPGDRGARTAIAHATESLYTFGSDTIGSIT